MMVATSTHSSILQGSYEAVSQLRAYGNSLTQSHQVVLVSLQHAAIMLCTTCIYVHTQVGSRASHNHIVAGLAARPYTHPIVIEAGHTLLAHTFHMMHMWQGWMLAHHHIRSVRWQGTWLLAQR